MSWNRLSSVSEGHAGPNTGVTAVSADNGRIALFLADPGGGIFTAIGNHTSGWSPWSSVAQGHAGPNTAVNAVPLDSGRRIALFLADPGGGVFTAIGNHTNGWGRWSSVSEGHAGPNTSITAIPLGGGRIALFLADPGGGVFTAIGNHTSGWSPWSSVSQGHAGPNTNITAIPLGGGRLALFAADPGGGVFTASGSVERGWSIWTSVSQGHAGPNTSIAAVPLGDGRIALFAADPGGGVFTASGSVERGWSIWTSVSEGHARPNTSITAVPLGGGRIALFAADPGGGVFTASGSVERGWSIWTSVGGANAGPNTFISAVPLGGGRTGVFFADRNGGVFTTAGDSSSAIKHVFVLMLENRSFDHMLGFSGITGIDAATGKPTQIDGLTGNESNSFGGRTFKVSRGAPDVWDIGPGHTFTAVLEQLAGSDARYPSGGPYPPINNSGYVSSYAKETRAESAGEIMRCYTPDQLPVLTTLAREFVVCDRWFSSIPGSTEPNRFFMHAATSGTFDESPTHAELVAAILTPGGGFEFKNGTVFKLFEKSDLKFRIYADDRFPVASELNGVSVVFDIHEFKDFASDLKNPDFDASYIHIEPSYDVLDDFKDGNS